MALLIAFSACRKDAVSKKELLSNYEASNYGQVFKAFWTGISTKYSFWDIDTVNWDRMYVDYKPKFDSLDMRPYSDTTNNLCFQYMVNMTQNLIDGQYILTLANGGDFVFKDSLYKSYLTFIPKLMTKQRTNPVLPDTLFDHVVPDNYLTNFDYGIYKNFNSGQVFQITTGKVSKGFKNVYYAGLNYGFMLRESYYAEYASRPPRPVIQNFFKNIKQANCDAVILDLRNNRGGNFEDINFLAGQFTTKPQLYGYARYKTGEGRLDYTPLLPMSITPQQGAIDYNKTIVILANTYSASLCESVIQAFKSLSNANVVVIGEQTYGSPGFNTGNLVATNSGSFSVNVFAHVGLSNAAMQDKNHKFNVQGIVPDVTVNYTTASVQQMMSTGVDIQMEKAIQYIYK